jgi:hypothetical protein
MVSGWFWSFWERWLYQKWDWILWIKVVPDVVDCRAGLDLVDLGGPVVLVAQ